MSEFWKGFEKRSNETDKPGLLEASEIGGLGTLAAKELHDHRMHGGSKAGLAAELGGLGILAIPAAYKTGKYMYNKFRSPNNKV
jgi:hypothetical protein